MHPLMLHVKIILLAVALSALAGCASMDQDSDLPWNSQQPWEGTPAIPGLPTYK